MKYSKTQDSPVFDFDKDDVTRHIQYELKTLDKMARAFDYVYSKLTGLGNALYCKPDDTKFDLDSAKPSEGKNYNWLAIGCDNAHLLIRTYGTHHTIYTKLTETRTYGKGEKERTYNHYRYAAFTFHTNTRRAAEDQQDFLNENNFHDLEQAMPQILTHILDKEVQCLWNSVGFLRPDYVEIRNIYDSESIISVDKLIFCAEELSNKQMELYSEIEVLEILKSLPADTIGKTIGRYEITEVRTEFPKDYSEPYYHGVGIIVKERVDYQRIYDVYTLCRYHLDDLMTLVENQDK